MLKTQWTILKARWRRYWWLVSKGLWKGWCAYSLWTGLHLRELGVCKGVRSVSKHMAEVKVYYSEKKR